MSWSEMEFKGTLKKLNHKFCYSRRGSICLANTRTNTPTSNSTLRDWGEKEKKKDPLTENLKEGERGNRKKKIVKVI